MVATIATNPFTTTVSQGLFLTPSANGLVQGTAYPDPAVIHQLRRGWLSSSETIPMFGGVGIYEKIPGVTGGPLQALGVQVGRATSATKTNSAGLAGFSVFDQDYSMVNSPASPVPLAASYMTVMSYRLGSGARIAVACDPALVSNYGSVIGTADSLYWDYVDQVLVGAASASHNVGTGNTYSTTTGLVTLNTTTAHNIAPGETAVVASLTGTGSFASANGTFIAGAGTTGTVLTYTIATGLTMTITDSTGTVVGPGTTFALTGLGMNVLEIQGTNCMTVTYSSSLNTASWNYNGACAVLQI